MLLRRVSRLRRFWSMTQPAVNRSRQYSLHCRGVGMVGGLWHAPCNDYWMPTCHRSNTVIRFTHLYPYILDINGCGMWVRYAHRAHRKQSPIARDIHGVSRRRTDMLFYQLARLSYIRCLFRQSSASGKCGVPASLLGEPAAKLAA